MVLGSEFEVRGALRAGLHVDLNTKNTRRCDALFVTQGLRPRKANASAKHVAPAALEEVRSKERGVRSEE